MKKLLSILATATLIFTIPGGCSHSPSSTSEARDPSEAPIPDQTWSVSAELAEVYEQNGTLRVESIQPGLDTFSLTISLRSLSEDKEIGSVELGEDAWQTGWTDTGFYAVSLLKKVAYLYDFNANPVKAIHLPGDIQNLGFALLNAKADTALLGKGETAELILYDIESGTQRAVGAMNGSTRAITYENGCFYLCKADTGELLCIEEDAQHATSPYCSRQITYMYPAMGIGTTETNFCIYKAGKDTPIYVPFRAVDEIPLAATESAFLTSSSVGDGDILALYDLSRKTIGTLTIPAHAIAAEPIGNTSWLVTTKTGSTYSASVYQSAQFDTASLSVSAKDTNPTVTPPAQEPSTNSENKRILSVPILSQWPEFPTGCESVSTVMALRYIGEDITVNRFIDEYLPKSSNFYFQDGVKYGPSPYEYFIGSPRTSASYGCMAPVIYNAVSSYFGSEDRVANTTGMSIETLCSTYIDTDVPVLVWATINMADTYPGATWYLADGTRFHWPANEHCLVLVGYDSEKYYFNDPYKGAVVGYKKSLVNSRYEALGKQSIVIN